MIGTKDGEAGQDQMMKCLPHGSGRLGLVIRAIGNHCRFMSRQQQSVEKSVLGRLGLWGVEGICRWRFCWRAWWSLLESCFHYLDVVSQETGLGDGRGKARKRWKHAILMEERAVSANRQGRDENTKMILGFLT